MWHVRGRGLIPPSFLMILATCMLSACGVKMNRDLDVFGVDDETPNFLAGVPAQIVIVSGDAQTGLPSTQLGSPLVFRVVDFASTPVPNVTVNFAVTSGGGSLSVASFLTDGTGQGQLDWTLGAATGTQTMSAFMTGVPSVQATANSVPALPANLLKISGDTQTGTVATQLTNPIRVRVTDASSNPVSGVTVNFAVTAGGGSLSAASAATDATGYAQVNWTLGTAAGGGHQVTVSSTGLASETFTATGTAAAASALAFSVQPSTPVTAGANFATAPSVQIRDAYGNPAGGTNAITLAAYTNATCTTAATGTLSAAANPLAATAGTSAFTNVQYTKAETIYLRASAAGLTSACSNAVVVNAGTQATLAKDSGDAQTGTVAAQLTNPIVAKVTDANGNPVSGVTVNFAVTSGGGSLGAASAVTGADGLASVTWTLGTSTSVAQQVTASSAGLTNVVFSATPVAAAPAKLVVSGATTVSAGACSTAITVTRQDQYNNAASPASATAITTGGRGSGNFSTASNCSSTDNSPSIASGSSSVTLYFSDQTVETLTLTFDSTGLTQGTRSMTVSTVFLARTTMVHGNAPEQLAIGDLNRDGDPDIVGPTGVDDRLQVFLGNGDGTFQARVSYVTGDQPRGVKLADFNRDGFLDAVVTNWAASSFSILLGNGDGTFQAKSDTANGGQALEPYVADVNKDGKLDLLMTQYLNATLVVYMGNGDGTFAAGVNYTTHSGPLYIIAEDFDADGDLDVVVSNLTGSRVSYFRNQGAGTFAAKVDLTTGSNPGYMAAGDFNRDGKMDFAVSQEVTDRVGIFLGNGDGTFQARVDYVTGALPLTVASRDFNYDGKLDLVIASRDSDNLDILFGNGDGTFQTRVIIAAGDQAIGLDVGDLNHDGELDIVSNARNDDRLSIFLNAGMARPGTVTAQSPVNTVSQPRDIRVWDVNRDGRLDVVVGSGDAGNPLARVHYGAGDGSFSSTADVGATTAATGNRAQMLSGDFNRDGKLDAIYLSAAEDRFVFTPASGSSFSGFTNFSTGDDPRSIASGDFDADGDLDVAVANYGSNNVSVLLGDGAGSFAAAVNYAAGTSPSAVRTADMNRDGKLDLVVGTDNSQALILLGVGDGTFGAASAFAALATTSAIDLVDVNRDGRLDLVVAHGATGRASIYLGNGSGSLGAGTDYNLGTAVSSVRAFDINQDGRLDLACSLEDATGDFTRLFNNGSDVFGSQADTSAGANPSAVAIGDFNQDGVMDYVVPAYSDGQFRVFLGNP